MKGFTYVHNHTLCPLLTTELMSTIVLKRARDRSMIKATWPEINNCNTR
jgi:hypothetical protein